MEKAVISQYKASLKMLIDVINKCPQELWENEAYKNQYWRIVYHSLFYTALYLSESSEKFIPWAKHIATYNYLGTVTADGLPVVINHIYTKDEMIEYAMLLFNDCEKKVVINGQKEGGFYWLPMSKVEIQLYNLRHLQHHIGQLTERLHHSGITGIRWESSD